MVKTFTFLLCGLFKWEKPEESYVPLEKFLVDHQIQVVVNQRYQDSSLISNLHRATVPHDIRLFTVIHCVPGFEFLAAHTGLMKLIQQLYNVKLKRKWVGHYNELVLKSDKVILLAKDFESQFLTTYQIPLCNRFKLAVIPNPSTLDGELSPRKEKKVSL